jgi:hypothetical protein
MEFCADWGKKEGHAFVWGTSAAEKAFRRVGFRLITGYRQYMISAIRPVETARDLRGGRLPVSLKLSEVLEVWRTKNKEKGVEYAKLACTVPSAVINALRSLFAPRTPPPGIEIREEVKSYDDIKALYEKLRAGEKMVYLEQDQELVDWLFARGNHPHLRLFAYRGDELLAYLYIETSDPLAANIIDFASTDDPALRALLARARRDLHEMDCRSVTVAVNRKSPHQRKLLRSFYLHGFIPFYLGGRWYVKPLLFIDNNVLDEMSLWYVTDLWLLM